MTLLQMQIEFTRLVPKLVEKALTLYAGVTLGEVYRSDEQAEINALGKGGREELARALRAADEPFDGWERLALTIENNKGSGIRRSLHQLGLAIDLKLFAGQNFDPIVKEYGSYTYLRQSSDYAPLGEWWEKQHSLARWGGRFGDGGHFSFEYKGIK